MKSLKNKTTELPIKQGEEKCVTYIDLAKTCLNTLPQGGLNITEMIARQDVYNLLEKSNGEVKFNTKTEKETLKKCVSDMKWKTFHPDVIAFVKDVEKLD